MLTPDEILERAPPADLQLACPMLTHVARAKLGSRNWLPELSHAAALDILADLSHTAPPHIRTDTACAIRHLLKVVTGCCFGKC
eukprot:6905320-Prymnesium_polylepis.1